MKKFKVVEGKLTRADSGLALRVAHGVVTLIEDAGYRTLDAIVPQRDKSGLCVGEHDLICEKCRQDGAGRTKASFEIKLRIVYSPKTLPKAREQTQTLTWKLWPTAKDDAKHNFAERVCVLLRWNECDPFNVLGKWEATYAESISADATANKPENWRPLWGWKQRLPSAVEIKAAARANKIQKATEKARAKAQANEHKAFDRIYIQCHKCRKHNKEMRSVLDMLLHAAFNIHQSPNQHSVLNKTISHVALTIHHAPFILQHPPFISHRSSVTILHSWFTVHRSAFIHCSLFATHHSPVITLHRACLCVCVCACLSRVCVFPSSMQYTTVYLYFAGIEAQGTISSGILLWVF